MTLDDQENNRRLRQRLRAMHQHFPSTARAREAFDKSLNAMVRVVRRQSPTAEIANLGPDALHEDLYDGGRVSPISGLGDDYWSAIVKVDTDEVRDSLVNDASFMSELWSAARAGGFAPHAIQIESSETVERDYRGNWLLRWKA